MSSAIAHPLAVPRHLRPSGPGLHLPPPELRARGRRAARREPTLTQVRKALPQAPVKEMAAATVAGAFVFSLPNPSMANAQVESSAMRQSPALSHSLARPHGAVSAANGIPLPYDEASAQTRVGKKTATGVIDGAASSGEPKSIALAMLKARGQERQFWALEKLWNKESGWRVKAENRNSGAYGIPQALPRYKMASAGADWETNPKTQIAWGLSYIAERYGSPVSAWSHSQANGWY